MSFSTWFVRAAMIGVVGVAALLATAARADTIHLKDGRVLQGRVEKEEKDYIYFVVITAGVEQPEYFLPEQVEKIERSTDAPQAKAKDGSKPAAKDAPGAGATGASKTDRPRSSTATRVAILNFGPPSGWQGRVGNMVGVTISAKAFRDAIPLLEKDGVQVVVVRINSGGGYSLEMERLQDVFEKEYKPKFRTVGWVESAISAAAMGPYPIEEFYFMPEGNLGACTEFSGGLVASKGMRLEMVLHRMEKASAMAKRDPKIMRAMQIMAPLSASIDDNGEVSWFQDTSGQYVLNPEGQVFTINATDAVKFKFAKGIAATREELAKAMGLGEVEWVGEAAEASINKFMDDTDRTEKRMVEIVQKYLAAVNFARSSPPKSQERGAQISRAEQFLRQMQKMVEQNENFQFHFAGQVGAVLDPAFFEAQKEMLEKLRKE
ncbi:MAG: hypothetical protein JNM07_10585 [Phycisphaerae bacterium]|nr:hypothetical protein [Phycisphaerae bacterium]